jgi:hypothetical protein
VAIPDHDERKGSQADAGLLEYIDRRRLHQVRERRQRTLMRTTVALGLLAAILAVSNVILLNRLNAPSEAPPPAGVASATLAATPEPAGLATPPAARVPEPVAAVPRAAAPAPPSTSAPAASAESAPTPGPAVRAPMPTTAAEEDDSALRTARWLVQTHGRIEAEDRVAKVAEFYSGAEGAFWRRVLLNVRRAAEPRGLR